MKRQQRDEEIRRLLKKERIKKIRTILLVTAAAIGLIVLIILAALKISSTRNDSTSSGVPRAEISAAEYDFGNIPLNGGLIKKIFEIRNTGDGNLKIDEIRTSCHCTTARLRVGEKESPAFGMERIFSFWSQNISPTETGYLEVVFDPAYHGSQGIGAVERGVYLSTNDPKNKKMEIKISANVTL